MSSPEIARLATELTARVPLLPTRTNVAGKEVTTFAIGGPLSLLFEPQDEQQLCAVVEAAQKMHIAPHILGAGSNLLIASAGLDAPVLRLGRGFRSLKSVGEGLFFVGGSSSLMTVSREVAAQGYSGLEFAGGIPASLGGAVRMNAGAHGSELAACLERILLCMPDGTLEWKAPREFEFSYRKSGIPSGWIVVGAELRLAAGDTQRVEMLRRSFLEERKARQPLTSPCAGSVFKNPSPSTSAGSLIEKAGLKGFQRGGARISELHANWIVNQNRSAVDEEVRFLIAKCQEEVRAQFGISLVPEIVMWS